MPTGPQKQQRILSVQNTEQTAGVFWVCVKHHLKEKLILKLEIIILINILCVWESKRGMLCG